jgi:RNA-binding protein 12
MPPMSETNVIIRLQNLPWSAQAIDIRNFFKDCVIPGGGVHIIGGEDGLAFIAFR